MSKKVYSRITLQGMKSVEDMRIRNIDEVVNTIYQLVIQESKRNINNNYKYVCNNPSYGIIFYDENSTEIINGLKMLFPDCTIVFKKFLRDNFQQVKEFTYIDDTMKQFVSRVYEQDYFLIDWS